MARDAAGSDRKITVAEKRARVVELRRGRLHFADIGREVGVSTTRAWQLYQEALRLVPAPSVAEHRTEDLLLADDAIADLLKIARDHSKPRTSVEAWNAIRGYLERRARLLAMDTLKLEVSAEVDEQIAAIAAALAGGVGDMEPAGEAEAAGDAEAG